MAKMTSQKSGPCPQGPLCVLEPGATRNTPREPPFRAQAKWACGAGVRQAPAACSAAHILWGIHFIPLVPLGDSDAMTGHWRKPCGLRRLILCVNFARLWCPVVCNDSSDVAVRYVLDVISI